MGRAEDLFQNLEQKGEVYIDELIETRKSEEAFLDFKRSANNGSTSRLDDNDLKNLSRAISGFANSDGGVVIWGVDCSRHPEIGDVAQAKIPLENPHRFVSLLEGAMSGCTVPSVQGCRSIPIPSSTGGYVATLIPSSFNAPHQLTKEKKYLIRAGSNFEPVTHGVLAGMFGRRPQAVVFPNIKLDQASFSETHVMGIYGTLMLVNSGNVVAEDCFASAVVYQTGTEDAKDAIFRFTPGSNSTMFTACTAAGIDYSMMANRNFRLPPGGFVNVFNFSWHLLQAPTQGVHIKITAGCGGAPPYVTEYKVDGPTLNSLWASAFNTWKVTNERRNTDWHAVAAKMLGMK